MRLLSGMGSFSGQRLGRGPQRGWADGMRPGFFGLRFAHSSRSSLRVAYTGSYSSASPPQTRSLSALVGIVVARRPKGLPSTPFLLRKTVPFSRPRRQSQFCPPAAVAYLPPPGHARIPSAERHSAGKNAPPVGAPFFMEQGQAGVSFSFRSPPRLAMPITAQNRQVCHIFPKYYNHCYIHLAILQLCYTSANLLDVAFQIDYHVECKVMPPSDGGRCQK